MRIRLGAAAGHTDRVEDKEKTQQAADRTIHAVFKIKGVILI